MNISKIIHNKSFENVQKKKKDFIIKFARLNVRNT